MNDPYTGLKCSFAGKGYLMCSVPGVGRVYVHRHVWSLANGRPIPEGYEINHKNGIKTDNHPDNLECVTHSENQKHAVRTGLNKPPPQRSHRVLTDENIAEIRRDYKFRKVTAKMLAARLGVCGETVARVVRGVSWT